MWRRDRGHVPHHHRHEYAAPPSAGGEPRIVDGAFYSNAVDGTLHYSIALPPGYDTSGKRYPVVYVLHGLPADENAYKGIGGYADSLASTGHPAIIVGAQGARPGDTDPEWHNWGPGRDWETATESELVALIDDHYRTIRGARLARSSAFPPGGTAPP